jgi:alkanesulfonate monooxygenase SsuD/methylene tetrahydromethanopterin reductase-like flavin-dependent oxidoreductase (luciferase family)
VPAHRHRGHLHILGDAWPPAHVRLEMLEEAIQVMRHLFTGQEVNHAGAHYTVENARLYAVPPQGRRRQAGQRRHEGLLRPGPRRGRRRPHP